MGISANHSGGNRLGNLGGSCLMYNSGKAVSGTLARGIFAEKLGEDVVEVLLRPEVLASGTVHGEV